MSASSALLESLRRSRGAAMAGEGSYEGAVGVVGEGVPYELVIAAGLRPTRLHSPEGYASAADHYLGRGTEPWIRSLLGQLLDGAYPGLRFLVIVNDGEASRRLFHYLSVLTAQDSALPAVHFLDLQPQRRDSSRAYSRGEIGRLKTVLGDWAAKPISDDELRAAIRARNGVRSLLGRLLELRRVEPVLMTGTEALCLLDAENHLPLEEQARLFGTLLEEAPQRQPIGGARTFVTGSPLEHDWPYRMIEEAGGVVVGEDHAWGEMQLRRPAADDGDPLEAIVAAYATPLTASLAALDAVVEQTVAAATASSARAVLSLVIEGDPTPAWDYPSQAAALAAVGLRTMLLDGLTPQTSASAVGRIAEFIESLDPERVATP